MLKRGLSGLIRAKNEGRFLEGCILSCINALDELIVVYNDCSDDTEMILEKLCERYPAKLKVFPYNHNVLSHNLTKEEYEIAKNLPDDSPRLHCNQCNYALSKASYEYAVKIDPDQIYFEDEVKKWRDVCSGDVQVRWQFGLVAGWLFMIYISAYRRISAKIGFPCIAMMPDLLVKSLKRCYGKYAQWRLQKGTVAISFSGVNVYQEDGAWYIPFDRFNTHPPYNGEGDTLLFPVSKKTFFSRRSSDKPTFFVTEIFHHPYKVMMADAPIWFHLHANRKYCVDKVRKVREARPDLFVRPKEFVKMRYEDVLRKMNPNLGTLYQRILFLLVHKMGLAVVQDHLPILKQIKL